MAETQASRRFVRFGAFEADVQTGELRKDGVKLKFSGQPFQVLAILLERPGEVVTREELQKRLWPDTFVDVERNLNTAINKIREALGDSAESPRFVETLTRRGYRFIGELQEPVQTAVPEVMVAPDRTQPRRGWWKTGTVVAGRERSARWMWRLAAMGAVVIAIVVAAWYLSRPVPPPRITEYTQITHDGRAKRIGGTDGSRKYITQFSPNVIMQIGVNGGETVPVPISLPGTFSTVVDISPDGSNALIATTEAGHETDPMWVVPILGGAATRLGDGISESFSPDGASVIYSTLKGDIFIVRTDGTENHKLASVGSVARNYSWSPDGKAIRFDKDGKLWEMSSEGAGLHRLLPNWHEREIQYGGYWTHDGHLYLFNLRNPIVPAIEIWALDEGHRLFWRRSPEPIRLTSGPIVWGGPLPSRDGKKIFARGVTVRGELARIDPKTRAVQPFLGGISAECVSFSPDGKSIAYVSFPEGILWKANRDGSNRVKLSGPPDYPGVSRWSPDSKQIIFLRLTPDGHSVIYLVSADGGTPQKLLPEYDVNTWDCSWSPDGKRILFDWGGFRSPPEKRDLRILDLNNRKLTTIPGSTGLWSSRWSPDGRYIFALAWPQTPDLRVFDVKTQRWAALPPSGDVEWPNFSRDSRFIYFLRHGRDQGVIRIPVTGGKEERVVDMTNWHMTGYFGYSMTLDPADAPLVLRDVGSNDIYALTLER
jgi:DNA-binding winged helix-turn-helix (wHTH) protein/Tol biopolymer transport system component